jgi:hypothetical protein
MMRMGRGDEDAGEGRRYVLGGWDMSKALIE